MTDLAQLTEFFGWTLVINSCFLAFATLALAVARPFIVPIHTKILGIDEAQLLQLYASYLSNYKIAVLLFSFTPYIALKIMG